MQAATPRASAGPARRPLLEREDLRTLERLSLESLDAILAGLVGQREGPGRASGFEFAGYRRYTPGDDVRRIDWNIYQRLHELHVRIAPQEASVWLAVLLDASRSMDSGEPNKLRYGSRLAALLGAIALLHADAVEVHALSDGGSVTSGSFDAGGAELGVLVDELERLPSGRTTELDQSIRRSAKSGWQPEMAVLISDALVSSDALAAAILELARAARSATLVHVVDPGGGVSDWAGSTVLLDIETGRRIDATISAQVQEEYAARYARWCVQVEQQCRAQGVGYVKAPASTDPLELLIDSARQQSLVRAASSA